MHIMDSGGWVQVIMCNTKKLNRLVYFSGFTSFVLLVLFAPLAKAQSTYTAIGCSQAAVSVAIVAEQVHPVDGDIIAIPACSGGVTWTTGINQTFANSVTIQGAGAISATAGGASTTGADNTVIVNGLSAGRMLTFTTTAGKSFRLTGISVQSNSSSFASSDGMVDISGDR